MQISYIYAHCHLRVIIFGTLRYYNNSINISFAHFNNTKFRNSALANALAMEGHNITIASPDKDMKPPKGVHYIHFEGVYSENYIEQRKNLFDSQQKMNPFTKSMNDYARHYDVCKGIQFDKKLFLMRPKRLLTCLHCSYVNVKILEYVLPLPVKFCFTIKEPYLCGVHSVDAAHICIFNDSGMSGKLVFTSIK